MDLKPVVKKGAAFAAVYSVCAAAVVWLASLASADAGIWALLAVCAAWLPASAVGFYRMAEPAGRGGWARAGLTGFAASAGAAVAGLALTGLALFARLSAGYPYGLDNSKEHSLLAAFVALIFAVPTPLAGLLSGLGRNWILVSKDPGAAPAAEGGRVLGKVPAGFAALFPLLALLGGAVAVFTDLLWRINKGYWGSPAWPWRLAAALACCGAAAVFYRLFSARRSGEARELFGFSTMTLGVVSLLSGFVAALFIWRFPG